MGLQFFGRTISNEKNDSRCVKISSLRKILVRKPGGESSITVHSLAGSGMMDSSTIRREVLIIEVTLGINTIF